MPVGTLTTTVAVDGTALGTVRAMHNFGAGDMIEIEDANGKTELLPFTIATVPSVDLDEGRVVIDPPHEIFVRPDATEDTDADDADGEAGQ